MNEPSFSQWWDSNVGIDVALSGSFEGQMEGFVETLEPGKCALVYYKTLKSEGRATLERIKAAYCGCGLKEGSDAGTMAVANW